MQSHEYANLFPMMSDDELADLTTSIATRGLINPIITLDGLILDGRNRYEACKRAKTEPRFEEYSGDDPLGYVVANNHDRRHLSVSQKSLVAAKIEGLERGQKKSDAQNCVTQKDAASSMNVSPRSLQSAKAVIKSGDDALIAAVEQDRIPVNVAEKAARLEAEARRRVVESDNPQAEIKAIARAYKLKALTGKPQATPDKKYTVIYADPPWSWDTYSETGKDRTPENHYPLMKTKEICELELPAAADAVLFLWVTVPHMETAFTVLKAWGFEYKSQMVWFKDRMGTGYWFRNQHEILIVATKGDVPAPLMGTQASSVIEAPVGRHSEKPEVFRAVIDQYFGGVPKLEMFARNAGSQEWDVWGNEADKLPSANVPA